MVGHRGPATAIVASALALAACTSDGGTPLTGSSAPDASSVPRPAAPRATTGPDATHPDTVGTDESTVGTVGTDGAPSDPTGTAVTHPRADIEDLLAEDPLVIFNAYPPKPDHVTYELPPGQRDFFDLWEPGAPWQTALEHVDVYRLHAFQMRHFLDDDQLVTLIEFLREHDIALMLETEPLIPPRTPPSAPTPSRSRRRGTSRWPSA